MPTPLKKSFNILNTSPNYPSCHKYYSLFISSDLFCSVRLVYTLNKKNLSARLSNEILWDNYTINDEQNLTLLFCDHHHSVLYCFCYRHLARPRMRLLRLRWMLHLLRWKEILGFFSSQAFAVWGPGWSKRGHINQVKCTCKHLLKKYNCSAPFSFREQWGADPI